MKTARWLLFLLVALLPACGSSISELSRIVGESRACEAGDTCVLAGGSQCTCDTAVNAEKKRDVDVAAVSVDCGGAMVECAACLQPRCVEGLCRCQ